MTNIDKSILLNDLSCGTTYHYEIYAENSSGTESYQTPDETFETLPCGIVIDSLVMTKSSARANDEYGDGWEWEFGITVWDLNETFLKMKFNRWSGNNFLDAAANMKYSADNGVTWADINANAVYPSQPIDISAIDNDSSAAGRQVEILVRMKVPFGTSAGYYNSGYGILTE